MLDLGLSKLAVIGVIALVVLGPEKLPRVARTVGLLLGKAQRYMQEVKDEVNRNIQLDELREAANTFETHAREAQAAFDSTAQTLRAQFTEAVHDGAEGDVHDGLPPSYQHPNKHWRLKRTALPQWYKSRAGVRRYAQSGAARVARFRPKR